MMRLEAAPLPVLQENAFRREPGLAGRRSCRVWPFRCLSGSRSASRSSMAQMVYEQATLHSQGWRLFIPSTLPFV
jgi:hypothetical protein